MDRSSALTSGWEPKSLKQEQVLLTTPFARSASFIRGLRGIGAAIPIVLFAILLAGLPQRAAGQSITSGTVEGTLRSTTGEALDRARVVVTDLTLGTSRVATTGPDGFFAFWLLPAGDYTLFAEALGYRPKRISPLAVRPGGRIELPLSLTPVRPPVRQVEPVSIGGRAGSEPGMRQWMSDLELDRVPDDRRESARLGRLSTVSNDALDTEGLPGGLSGTAIDGLIFEAARNPDLATGPLRSAIAPLSALGHAELITNTADVEWSEISGGILGIHSRRGTRRFEAHAFGAWSGDALSFSDFFEPDSAAFSDLRAGLLLSGPISQDTAQFVLGGEGQWLETPFPRAWEPTSEDAALLAVARDSFGTDTIAGGLAGYVKPRVVETRTLSVFGGADWQVTPRHRLSLRGNFVSIAPADPALELGPARSASLGSVIEGDDSWTGIVLASEFNPTLAGELRVGVERSPRDYLVSEGSDVEDFGRRYVPGTRLVDPGVRFGVDPAFPGRLERTTLRASEALYMRSGTHRFKFGASGAVASHDNVYLHGRAGEFSFGGVDEFARREGVFLQAVGPIPAAKFTVSQVALFLQDTWNASRGLDLTLGVRYDFERLPASDVTLNRAWFDSTGAANTVFDQSLSKLSQRASFRWDPQGDHRWVVHGAAGLYHGTVDPGLLGEVIATDEGVPIRRGVGVLNRWLGLPDSATAPVVGSRLTLLDRDFEPPRTTRASLGLSHVVDAQTAVVVSGTFRRTSSLPVRRDANLIPAPVGQDQYGRPIFGALVQQGSLLAALPRSNRRFSEFDLVSEIEPDGESDYWGATIGVERRAGDASLVAHYTFSRTEDNWLSGWSRGPEAQLTPFPTLLNGVDWADGRSDFDVPHRIVVGTELRLPLALGVYLAGLYRYRSGHPFTPGFRDGVDANGDGSAVNDPAFVDASVPGVSGLLAEWDCLREQEGRFAERNACRAPGVHSLDLRLRIPFAQLGRHPAELIVDGLNLIESESGLRDHALYLVDETRSISIDPLTGQVTVPLIANPRFGELLVRHTPARVLRVGLRIGY